MDILLFFVSFFTIPFISVLLHYRNRGFRSAIIFAVAICLGLIIVCVSLILDVTQGHLEITWPEASHALLGFGIPAVGFISGAIFISVKNRKTVE